MRDTHEPSAASTDITVAENGQVFGEKHHPDDEPYRLNAKEWIVGRFNWSWFTCTQSTGGVAIVLSECPKQFDGLHTIGAIVFIFNLVLWLLFSGLVITRWIIKPAKVRASFTQPPECFFYASWWLSLATIIICMQKYGVPHSGPWLVVAVRICFWIYAACTLLSSAVIFVVLSKHSVLPEIGANPAILLTAFHAMLTGTIAAAIVDGQPPDQRIPMMIAGVGYQGFGWIMGLVYLAHLITFLLRDGLPPPRLRPGMYMLVAVAGFTILVLIGNARAAPVDYGYFAAHPMAAEELRIMATWVGIFLWVFTFWCFMMATISVCIDLFERDERGHWRMSVTYHNTWWAFVFPNIGLTVSTIFLGQELESNAILWVGTAMVILLVVMWLFDMTMFIRTITYSLFWDSRIKLS